MEGFSLRRGLLIAAIIEREAGNPGAGGIVRLDLAQQLRIQRDRGSVCGKLAIDHRVSRNRR